MTDELIPHPKAPVSAIRKVFKIGYGSNVFRIRQITDTHHKGDGFRDDLFNSFVKTQAKDYKNSAWIHTGDVGNPDRNSRREIDEYSNANRKDEIITQNEKNKLWVEHFIIPKYEKIKDTCLGFIAGDHYMVIDGEPCTKYIAKRLGVPYIGERSGFVIVAFMLPNGGSFNYIIHARHGKSGAGTPGGDMSSLIKQDVGQYADLHLGAHTHKQNAHPARVEYVNGRGLVKSKVIWYMRGGSFLDNPAYAKKAEYTPLPCGWGEVELHLKRAYHGEGKSRICEIAMSKASIIAA